jgi:hypothetical protein
MPQTQTQPEERLQPIGRERIDKGYCRVTSRAKCGAGEVRALHARCAIRKSSPIKSSTRWSRPW